MKKQLLIALLASAFFSNLSNALTFEETIALYVNKNYDEAYQSFRELASLGNTKAQLNLAVMHARGESVRADLIEASAWAMLARDNQEAQAEGLVDTLTAKLSKQELNHALKRLENLKVEFSNQVIIEQLVPVYSKDGKPVVEKLEAKAPKYPLNKLQSASFGVVEVTGMVDKEGSIRYPSVLAPELGSFEKVSLEAFKKFKYIPATADNTKADTFGVRNRFIFQMEDSRVNKKHLQEHLDQLKKNAEENGGIEKFVYAKRLSSYQSAYNGIKGYDDITWDESFSWMYKAAQDGVALAKFELGLAPLTGDQCAQNTHQSLHWLQSAANDGIAEAKLILGYEYLQGKRCQKDEKLGFQYLTEAANTIDHGKVLLAWLYATSNNQDYINYQKAKSLLKQVNEKEYADLRSYYETQAAIALGLDDQKAAKKALKKLAKQNRKLDTPKTRELALKAALKGNSTYSEAI